MRMKYFWPLLLIPLLALTILSCDLDTLGKMMGDMGTNAYQQAGLVTIDTSHGDKIAGALGGLGGLDPDGEGYEEAYAEQVENIKQALGSANTPQKKEALKESLGKPIEPNEDIPEKVSDAIDKLKDFLGDDDDGFDLPDPTTQGDLLTLVLLTEVFDKVYDENTKGLKDDLSPDELVEILSDTLLIIDTVRDISPAGSINLDDILEELLGDDDLLNQLFRSRQSNSRDGDSDSEDDEWMPLVESLFNTIINNIGTKKDGDHSIIDSEKLNRAMGNFAVMRVSYELMVKSLEKGADKSKSREIGLSDVTSYLISVIFTEADKFFSYAELEYNESEEYTLELVLNEIIAWQEDGSKEDEPPNFIEALEDSDKDFESFFDSKKELFGEDGTVVKTLEGLTSAIPGTNLWTKFSSMFEDGK